jgi:hypothetical protein
MVPIDKTKRLLGLMQIIYIYGGMLTPISFACFKNLIDLYYKGTVNNKPFFVENVNYETTSRERFLPSPCFMGAFRNDESINSFIIFVKNMIEKDYSNVNTITGKIQDFIIEKNKEKTINIIKGNEVGVMTKDEKPILIEDLMGNSYLNIEFKTTYGIWIPSKNILKRTNYQWFARMSQEQVLLSNIMIGKYILKAVAPKSDFNSIFGEIDLLKPNSSNKEFVSYWNTPLYKGLYGLQPIYLGQDVQKNKEPHKNYKFVGVIA